MVNSHCDRLLYEIGRLIFITASEIANSDTKLEGTRLTALELLVSFLGFAIVLCFGVLCSSGSIYMLMFIELSS